MANINLISARRADRLRMNKIARGMMGGLVGAVLLGLGSVTFNLVQYKLAEGRIATVDKHLNTLRPIRDRITAAEKQRMELLPKLKTLEEAQKKTERWRGMLAGFKQAVPEQTWLTSFALESASGDGPRTLRLNGVTVNHGRVGETMIRLLQQPQFYQKVDLRQSTTSSSETSTSIEFELAAQLYQPELQKAKEEKGNAGKSN